MKKTIFALTCLAISFAQRDGPQHNVRQGNTRDPHISLGRLLLASTVRPSLAYVSPSTSSIGRHSTPKATRREVLAAGAALPALVLGPFAAIADSRNRYPGLYTDPLHPRCTRSVQVKGSDVTITGTDVKGGDLWTVAGKVSDGGLSIDFSPKGGPTTVAAEWTGDGFKFPDGNKWTKITEKDRLYALKIAGGYVDPKLEGSDIAIAVGKEGVTIKGSDGIGGRKWTLYGDVVGKDFYVDFTPLGGKKDTRVERTDVALIWDGGLWQSKGDGNRRGKI